MRVRFFRPTDEAETAEHLAFHRRTDQFWSSLTGDTALKGNRVAATRAAEALARVHPGLIGELTSDLGDVALTIRDSERRFGAIADAVLERAPRSPGLRVQRYRSARSFDALVEDVRSRHGIDLSAAKARAGFTRGHLLDVIVHAPAFSEGDDGPGLDAAVRAVVGLLGEERYRTWIGTIDVAAAPRGGPLRVMSEAQDDHRFPLAELPLTVERAIASVDAEVGDRPCHRFCEKALWTMLEVEPEASDASSGAQRDVVQCVTMLPEMTKSYLSGAVFSSRRFSATGERFVYLKAEVGTRSIPEQHELRLAVEDALNYALVPGRFGCVVAVAFGLRHLYWTLALSELDAGIELARRTTERLLHADRAWIQFCDSEWALEWVGVTDTTPPPVF